jgi:hypothetical protein
MAIETRTGHEKLPFSYWELAVMSRAVERWANNPSVSGLAKEQAEQLVKRLNNAYAAN